MSESLFVMGGGAVGMPLAAFLRQQGRDVTVVRMRSQVPVAEMLPVKVAMGSDRDWLEDHLPTVALSQLTAVQGVIVVTAKAAANVALARQLAELKAQSCAVVLLQNGLGVEEAFLAHGFKRVYRAVLYLTSQTEGENGFRFQAIGTSPVGVLEGETEGLAACVELLSTPNLPFHRLEDISREVWKKAIINSVFNSICPLMEVDNGVFVERPEVAQLAKEMVMECLRVTERLSLSLQEEEVMSQLMKISAGSRGQLISTLQDIQAGRSTEMAWLNLKIAEIAAGLVPPVPVPRVECLGRLVEAKASSRLR